MMIDKEKLTEKELKKVEGGYRVPKEQQYDCDHEIHPGCGGHISNQYNPFKSCKCDKCHEEHYFYFQFFDYSMDDDDNYPH